MVGGHGVEAHGGVPALVLFGRGEQETTTTVRVGPVEHRFHQRSTDRPSLPLGIDPYRSNPVVRTEAGVALSVGSGPPQRLTHGSDSPRHDWEEAKSLLDLAPDGDGVGTRWKPGGCSDHSTSGARGVETTKPSRIAGIGGEVAREHSATGTRPRKQVAGFGELPERPNHARDDPADVASVQPVNTRRTVQSIVHAASIGHRLGPLSPNASSMRHFGSASKSGRHQNGAHG